MAEQACDSLLALGLAPALRSGAQMGGTEAGGDTRAPRPPWTTHLGAGTGVAQEVGAGDQAVPEASTPTAPHTAVAAGDGDAGGRRAGGDGAAHLGPCAARGLVCRLPASPTQHRARTQVVLGGVP